MSGTNYGADESPGNLARKAARGAFVSVGGQGANFILRTLSMVVIARLVTPEHFGLVGMVTALTGVLSLFRDVGLGAAMVQRESISHDLVSAMFWINVAIGLFLALLALIAAPLIAAFYNEPRLLWITIALASSFVFNGASVQHRALLQRSMRFGVLTALDIVSLVTSIGLGIGMAMAGLGYWALVAMAISQPMINFVGLWATAGWKPRSPGHALGVGSMLHYGGLITANSLVMYVAYNVDKVLLGRFFGPEVLGSYGRAYQLISLPSDNLHTALSGVLFPALSRVQDDPPRRRTLFLTAYGLFLAAIVPIILTCGLFAEEIVRALLGPRWDHVVPIFRLLVPTMLAHAMLNPLGPLMQASGHAARSMKMGFFIAPVVIAGYALGLSSGAQGVALGFSAAMMLIVMPAVYWARKDMSISMADIAHAVIPPCISALVGAAIAMAIAQAIPAGDIFLRLAVLPAALFLAHVLILAYFFGQKQVYANLWRRVFASRAGVPPDM